MPKLKRIGDRPPEARRELTKEIQTQYGGALTLTEVMKVIGAHCPKVARKWIEEEGLEAVLVCKRKKWLASDIARALDNSKVRAS